MNVSNFFFAPASLRPVAGFRVGVCVILLVQAISLSESLFDLYGSNALVQLALADHLSNPVLPKLHWVLQGLSRVGISEAPGIMLLAVAYCISLCALLVGWHTRAAAFIAWVLHLLFVNSAPCANYGVDIFAGVSLFYLIWMNPGGTWSIDSSRNRTSEPDPLARLYLRVLQFHLCIVYLTSGLEKAAGPQWWNGEVIWRSLMLPIYAQYDFSWLAWYPWLPKLLAWGTLLLETGYCIFIWPRLTRKVWLPAIIGLHVGIAVFLGLWLFSAFMCLFSICAFGISPKPKEEYSREQVLVFYDGACASCNAFVVWLLHKDVKKQFLVSSLSGQTARMYFPLAVPSHSIQLVCGKTRFEKSDAVISILSRLGFPFGLVSIALVVPSRLRNWIYDQVAVRRTMLSTSQGRCQLISAEEAARVLP